MTSDPAADKAADRANDRAADRYVRLPDRGVLALAGDDVRGFLQGLVTNDVDALGPGHSLHAALLTSQGKYLHDFFLAEHGGRVLLDTDGARRDDLVRRLTMYRLRARVEIADETADWTVVAVLPGGRMPARPAGATAPWGGGVAMTDPRSAAMGGRAILPAGEAAALLAGAGFAEAPAAEYDALRVRLGIADGARDLTPEKSLPLEFGFGDLNGVSFDKGCYVGQEVTARMHHRSLVKRRLLPVTVDGPVPDPGTPVMAGDIEAGEVRSVAGGAALAWLRLDLAERDDLAAGGARLAVTPRAGD